MDKKVLTVSIAAYNVEAYLEKTLSSLICSESIMKKIEVLVIDDGSIDNTAKIAQKYVNDYPDTFVLIRKENGGHGSTLNTSVVQAHGKYFKMLDGDDWYETLEFEKLVLELENRDTDIVLCPYERVYVQNGSVEEVNRHSIEMGKDYCVSELNDSLLEIIHAHEMTVKTELLQKHGFNVAERCAFTDDEYVFNAIMYAKTYVRLPYSVYRYQVGMEGQTVSETGRKKHWLDAKKVVVDMLSLLRSRKEEISVLFQKQYLYQFIKHTADFQCDNFYYADSVDLIEKELRDFINQMQKINQDFVEFFRKESYSYRWMQWLFGLPEKLNGKKCLIWGAGKYGQNTYRILSERKVKIIGFVDNSSQLWGKTLENIYVIEPQTIKEKYTQETIILAVKNHRDEIKEQLFNMGISSDRILYMA